MKLTNYNLTNWVCIAAIVLLVAYDILAKCNGWWMITGWVKKQNKELGWLPFLIYVALGWHFFSWQIWELAVKCIRMVKG